MAGELTSLSLSLGAGLVTSGAGGAPPSGNVALLAAVLKDGTALMGLAGGSRQRYNGIGGGTQVRSYSAGPESWSRVLNRRYRFPWYNSSGVDTNGNGMSGMIFAGDGEAASALWQRLPAIIASDANFVIIAMSSNTVQLTNYDIYGNDLGTTPTAEGYWSLYRQIINKLIAAGKAVIIENFWERNTTAGNPGPVWASGAQPRLLIPAIMAVAQSECAALGVPFFDTRATIINFSDPDLNPHPDLVQSDGTHESIKGGYLLGKAFDAFMGSLGFASTVAAVDETVAGNLVPNSSLSNAGGTGVLVGTWAVGSVVPDGWTLSRVGTGTATVRSDFVTISGRRYLKVTYLTAPTDGTQEGWNLKPTANIAVVSGDRHLSRIRMAVDAFNGYYGNPNTVLTCGTSVSSAMTPTKPAGGAATDMTDMAMHPGPTEAYSGVIESQPNLPSTNTTCVFQINGASIRAGGNTGAYGCAVGAPEVRVTTNPAVIMYDEANTTPPVLTSSANLTDPEESPFSTQLTASKSVRWSLTGTDVALFTVDKHGLLRLIAIPDYDGDPPKRSYSINIVMTDFNPAVAAVTVPWTLTITDIDDGFTDLFNGTPGLDLADANPNVTRIGGASGAISIHTNGTDAVNNLSAPRTCYLYPQQGETDEQRVTSKIATASAKMHRALRIVDQDNALYYTEASNQIQVFRLNGGVLTPVANFTPWKSLASNDFIGAQIRNDQLEVWQNDVPLALASGSRTISGANFFDGVKRSGLLSSQSSGSNNRIYEINLRVSAPHVDKVGILALTASTLTGSPNQPYEAAITTIQPGSTINVSDASGLFYMDAGNTLKAAAPPGGTYNITLTEANPNAAAPYQAGRATVLTVAIS